MANRNDCEMHQLDNQLYKSNLNGFQHDVTLVTVNGIISVARFTENKSNPLLLPSNTKQVPLSFVTDYTAKESRRLYRQGIVIPTTMTAPRIKLIFRIMHEKTKTFTLNTNITQ